MKQTRVRAGWVALSCLVLAASAARADDFKGKDDPTQLGFGGMAGMGILDNHVGFEILGTASKKIVNRGFAGDIANSVSIEAELGPLFVPGGTAFAYSMHMRWDFDKDNE
jgi:hypothetical protein